MASSDQTTKTRPPARVENPSDINVSERVVGEHRWFGLKLGHRSLTCCRWCGVVQRADRLSKPCRGIVRVAPRAEACHVG